MCEQFRFTIKYMISLCVQTNEFNTRLHSDIFKLKRVKYNTSRAYCDIHSNLYSDLNVKCGPQHTDANAWHCPNTNSTDIGKCSEQRVHINSVFELIIHALTVLQLKCRHLHNPDELIHRVMRCGPRQTGHGDRHGHIYERLHPYNLICLESNRRSRTLKVVKKPKVKYNNVLLKGQGVWLGKKALVIHYASAVTANQEARSLVYLNVGIVIHLSNDRDHTLTQRGVTANLTTSYMYNFYRTYHKMTAPNAGYKNHTNANQFLPS